MSGHSKWSTIKHDKAAADQKRGKAFSKIGRAISIAVKEGKSSDSDSNPRLRLAIEQARAVNMPNDNIKRAIERGAGTADGQGLEMVTYEGFGPEKIAIIIECITDNKYRTGAEIRSYFERRGGGLASPGSAAYLFEKKGLISVSKLSNVEDQTLKLIDLGAQEIEEKANCLVVYTQPEQLETVKNKISQAGLVIQEAGLFYKPTTLIPLSDKHIQDKVISFLKELEDFEDVQKVYCNADFLTS